MSDKVVEAYNDNEAAMGPAGRLREYLPELANMQLVTDTGALVGELGAPLYEEFGRIAHNRGRRN